MSAELKEDYFKAQVVGYRLKSVAEYLSRVNKAWGLSLNNTNKLINNQIHTVMVNPYLGEIWKTLKSTSCGR